MQLFPIIKFCCKLMQYSVFLHTWEVLEVSVTGKNTSHTPTAFFIVRIFSTNIATIVFLFLFISFFKNRNPMLILWAVPHSVQLFCPVFCVKLLRCLKNSHWFPNFGSVCLARSLVLFCFVLLKPELTWLCSVCVLGYTTA